MGNGLMGNPYPIFHFYKFLNFRSKLNIYVSLSHIKSNNHKIYNFVSVFTTYFYAQKTDLDN